VTEIPDALWGRPDTLPARLLSKFAATRPGSRVVRALMPLDRWVLVRSTGRRTILGPFGIPVLLLETTGRKSGLQRISPLLFSRDVDSVIVVGSNFGQAHHPAWTGNLIANPTGVVVVGGRRIPVTATLLEGAEAETAYQRMIEVTEAYSAYRGRTDRQIRVFRLTPTG
jgi:deazaflavin-dependent oxidoreductase (nitroreductase family)